MTTPTVQYRISNTRHVFLAGRAARLVDVEQNVNDRWVPFVDSVPVPARGDRLRAALAWLASRDV